MQITFKSYHLIRQNYSEYSVLLTTQNWQIFKVMFIQHDMILKRNSASAQKEDKIVQFLIITL